MIPVEPISLTIGAVALASMFSLCVQCFDLIEIAKNLGSEGELLIIKLSIEKRRLMIWGEAIGILRPDTGRDSLLDEPETRQLIERILGNLQKLFYEAEVLKSKYGLEAVTAKPNAPVGSIEGSSVCSSAFENSLIVQFQAKLFDHHGKVGLRAKTKWAIRDSKKFSALVQNVKDLLDGLSQITPSTSTIVLRGQLIRQETESIPDLRTLEIIETTCSDTDWRSSASAASEYLGRMGHLSADKKSQIAEWVTANAGSAGDEGEHRQQGRGSGFVEQSMTRLTVEDRPPQQLRTVKVLVLCSSTTLKAYIEPVDRTMKFHPVKYIPSITTANKITASRMMKAIVVPPQVHTPSITIYCPPRMRFIHMALSILNPIRESQYCFQIRFDDRLIDSSTSFSMVHERMLGYHRDIEAAFDNPDPAIQRIVNAIDMNWLEQRIEVLRHPSENQTRPFLDWHTIFRQSRDDTSCVGIIVMAGQGTCADLLATPPVTPPAIFREGRIFRLREFECADARSRFRYQAEHFCNVATDKEFEKLVNSPYWQ